MSYRSGFFQNRRGVPLFYAEETPDASHPAPMAWIVCAPILEESTVAHDVFRRLARHLAANGHHVLRLDYEGHGDSDGDTAGVGLHEWAHDVEDAAVLLRHAGHGRIGLIGCRAGAMVAAMAAPVVQAERLIAWCPVVNGHEYEQELLRLNLTAQLTVFKRVIENRDRLVEHLDAGHDVNILGWDIGAPLHRSLRQAEFGALRERAGCPVDVLQISGVQFWEDPRVIDTEQAALTQATVDLVAGTGGAGR